MNTEEILSIRDASILLIEERERRDIVIGAPHHSIGGVKFLPCKEHPDADENSGFIAKQIAETLKLSSIIACNYRTDPNKYLGTDYSKQIIEWAPKYLIEIHGHGAKSIDLNKIEVSSGCLKRNDFSKLFASTLQSKLNSNINLKNYLVEGDFNNLYFKGLKSATIVEDRWTSLQIELPPSIRIDPSNDHLPIITAVFTKYLIETISEICV